MTPNRHHPTCETEQNRAQITHEAWKARWPDACPACDGEGGFQFGDGSQPPENSAWMECPLCLGDNRCPRCAGPWVEDSQQCSHCDWTGHHPEDAAPDVPVCQGDCWGNHPNT